MSLSLRYFSEILSDLIVPTEEGCHVTVHSTPPIYLTSPIGGRDHRQRLLFVTALKLMVDTRFVDHISLHVSNLPRFEAYFFPCGPDWRTEQCPAECRETVRVYNSQWNDRQNIGHLIVLAGLFVESVADLLDQTGLVLPENEQIIWLDLDKPVEADSLYRRWFDVPSDSLVHELGQMGSDMLQVRMKNGLCDRTSLTEWIKDNHQRNFLDMRSDLHVRSRQIGPWLDLLVPGSGSTEEFDACVAAGVMLLNNFMCLHISASSVLVTAKLVQEVPRNGTEVVLTDWADDTVRKLFRPHSFKLEKPDSRQKDKTVTKSYNWADLWLAHPLRAEVSSIVFDPWPITEARGLPPNDRTYQNARTLNKFTGYKWTFPQIQEAAITAHGRLCTKHFLGLLDKFCGGNQEWAQYMVRWMASIVQRPREKTKVAVIIKSQKGMGKGFLGRIWAAIFGKHYFFIGGTTLTSRFNSFMSGKKMIFIDEMKQDPGDVDILKSLITESDVCVERKYHDQEKEHNLVEFLAATNNDIRISVGSDARRFFVVESPSVPQAELETWRAHMSQVWTETLEDPVHGDLGVQAIFHYLATFDIDGWYAWKSVPQTDYLRKMTERSLHPVVAWWRFVIEKQRVRPSNTPGHRLEEEMWTWTDLQSLFKQDEEFANLGSCGKRYMITPQDFRSEAEKVMSTTSFAAGTSFRFNTWQSQVAKWREIYPSVTLDTALTTNPFETTAQKRIREKSVDPVVKTMSDAEKGYLIMRLREELERASGQDVTLSSDGELFSVSNKRARLN